MKKKILIIIVLLILITGSIIYSKINNSRSEFESEVMDNAYIIFGRIQTTTPDSLSYNSGYIYYYIDKEGNIVRDTRNSGENTKAKTVSIKKLSESEL